MTLFRPSMTNFKMNVRADCAVSIWSPLSLPVKAPTHWLSVVDTSLWTDVCPHKPPVASTQDKAKFPFYKSCLSIFWLLSGEQSDSTFSYNTPWGGKCQPPKSLGAQTYSWVKRGGETGLGIRQIKVKNQVPPGTSLVAQQLRLHAPNAGCLGLISDPGTKIPYATTKTWYSQIKKN